MNIEDNSPPIRSVGRCRERPISFSASAEMLVAGARFNDGLQGLPSGKLGFVPKGLHRFKTHEQANRQQIEWIAEFMARIAHERG